MSSRSLSEDVRRHLALGEVAEALLLLRGAVGSYPGSRFFSEKLALTAHRAGDLATCRDALDRARRLGSDAKALRLIEPELLLEEGQAEAAVASALGLLAHDPLDEDAIRTALAVLERQGHPGTAEAWRCLARIGRIAPNEAVRAARVLHQAGDSDAAHAQLDNLLAREPRNREALVEKTSIWLEALGHEGNRGLTALVALAERDLDAALGLLPFLRRRRLWDALLMLAGRARDAGVAEDAFEPLLGSLVQDLTRAEYEHCDAAVTTLLVILALVGPATEAAARLGLARPAMLRALTSAEELLGVEGSACAAVVVESLLAAAEAGGPAPLELALLAEQLDDPSLAVRACLACWRESREEDCLEAAIGAMGRAAPGQALHLFTSLNGLPFQHPLVAACGRELAHRAEAALAAGGSTLDKDLMSAARVLLGPGLPTEWPRRAARDYAGRLRQAVKEVDQAGEVAAAITLAEAAVALEPSKPYPWKVLARLYTARGNITAAKNCLVRLTALEPDNADHPVRYARRCRPGDDRRELLDVLVGAVGRHPAHAELIELVDRWLLEPAA